VRRIIKPFKHTTWCLKWHKQTMV